MVTTIILCKSACGARGGLWLETYLHVVSSPWLASRKKSFGASVVKYFHVTKDFLIIGPWLLPLAGWVRPTHTDVVYIDSYRQPACSCREVSGDLFCHNISIFRKLKPAGSPSGCGGTHSP